MYGLSTPNRGSKTNPIPNLKYPVNAQFNHQNHQ